MATRIYQGEERPKSLGLNGGKDGDIQLLPQELLRRASLTLRCFVGTQEYMATSSF